MNFEENKKSWENRIKQSIRNRVIAISSTRNESEIDLDPQYTKSIEEQTNHALASLNNAANILHQSNIAEEMKITQFDATALSLAVGTLAVIIDIPN